MSDLITVIVPIYKVEKYLDKCINSIVNQTYKNLEIILVDDGSPDSCPVLCDEWAKKDDRIRVLHKENGGLSDARNKGVEIANGNYVMFVDSDDWLHESICETLLSLLKKYDVDFSMCDACEILEDEQAKNPQFGKISHFKDEDVIKQLFETKFKYLATAWAKLYKKELFKETRYPVGKLHEDEFVIHKILGETRAFAHIESEMYYYLQRDTSIMKTRKQKSYDDTLLAYQERYFYLKKNAPQFESDAFKHILQKLKFLYLECPKIYKETKHKIFDEYKLVYKEMKKKPLKHWIFKNFTFVYQVLFNIKEKTKKE